MSYLVLLLNDNSLFGTRNTWDVDFDLEFRVYTLNSFLDHSSVSIDWWEESFSLSRVWVTERSSLKELQLVEEIQLGPVCWCVHRLPKCPDSIPKKKIDEQKSRYLWYFELRSLIRSFVNLFHSTNKRKEFKKCLDWKFRVKRTFIELVEPFFIRFGLYPIRLMMWFTEKEQIFLQRVDFVCARRIARS